MQPDEYKTATAAEMARILGISKSSLDKTRCLRPENGPPHFYIGRRVIYPLTGPNGFSAWMAGRMQGGGAGHE